MNLLKKFVRNDPADFEEEAGGYDDIYVMPSDIKDEMDTAEQNAVSAIDDPARKTPEIRPASTEKVALKLLQPKSHNESVKIADKLKEGCIVLLDISNLETKKAFRLIDFLAGVTYVLGGEMIKTNKNTIVVAPAGVDISGFAQEVEAEPAVADPEAQETNEEAPVTEEN
ncbi:MAG: cell division protein SepF [Clostridia bacterium]|nr:cell division protein SepF [Clostridia bacterium]